MLKLTFADAGGIPLCPALDSSEVERWRDAAGSVAAYAVTAGGLHWVVIPEVATFCFGDGSGEMIAVSQPGVEVEHVRELYRRVVLPAALQALGCEALHASGVRSHHGVLALCGASGAGKSTLAFALGRRGYPIWADDSVVLEFCGGQLVVVPTPFRLRLRPPVATFFGLSTAPACEDGLGSSEPVPLAGVFFLERFVASPAENPLELLRLSRADAFVGALRHVNCFSVKDSDRRGRLIGNYLDLVASVPVFRLRFASGLARLPEVVEAFTAAVDRTLVPPS